MVSNKLKLFMGNSNSELAKKIGGYLGVPLGNIHVGRFSDGEICVKVEENVRGADVFVIQSLCNPINDTIMELLIMIDALKRASARRITAVIPYFGYARQDRKDRPRVPITAKLISNLITKAGADRVLTMDLHAGQIQGFFDIPLDHLYAGPTVFVPYFMDKALKNIVIVSPDTGSVKRARALAKRLDSPIAIIDKRRPEDNVAEVMHVIGEVDGKIGLIMDDMIDTGGSVIKATEAILSEGVTEVFVSCTHGVLSGEAVKKIADAPIKELLITDTVPLPGGKKNPKIKILSVADIFGEAISRIHSESSVSSLFM